MLKKAYLYDFMISSGLVSLGAGLFLVYGRGVTLISIGGVVFVLGALGHYKGSK